MRNSLIDLTRRGVTRPSDLRHACASFPQKGLLRIHHASYNTTQPQHTGEAARHNTKEQLLGATVSRISRQKVFAARDVNRRAEAPTTAADSTNVAGQV
jgi:hypothetical protein